MMDRLDLERDRYWEEHAREMEVEITFTIKKRVTVTAPDEEYARDEIEQLLIKDEIEITNDDIDDYTFRVISE